MEEELLMSLLVEMLEEVEDGDVVAMVLELEGDDDDNVVDARVVLNVEVDIVEELSVDGDDDKDEEVADELAVLEEELAGLVEDMVPPVDELATLDEDLVMTVLDHDLVEDVRKFPVVELEVKELAGLVVGVDVAVELDT